MQSHHWLVQSKVTERCLENIDLEIVQNAARIVLARYFDMYWLEIVWQDTGGQEAGGEQLVSSL